jgi:hypothetical protein
MFRPSGFSRKYSESTTILTDFGWSYSLKNQCGFPWKYEGFEMWTLLSWRVFAGMEESKIYFSTLWRFNELRKTTVMREIWIWNDRWRDRLLKSWIWIGGDGNERVLKCGHYLHL